MRPEAAPVYVHVGLPKTGTTYLQSVLHTNRATLADAGTLYPGPRVDHFFESLDLLGRNFLGDTTTARPDSWRQLVDRTRGHAGPVLVSHEMLTFADQSHIERILLDFGDRPVHVVLAVRDIARQVPALWQEDIKNRGKRDLDTYVSTLRSQVSRHSEGRLRIQVDPRVALSRWSTALPPEHVHVITVPPSGGPREELWGRFAAAVGLDPTRYDPTGKRANESLGAASAALLLRLNRSLAEAEEELPSPHYRRLVKRFLAQRALVGREEPRIQLSQPTVRWCAELSQDISEWLSASGYQVHGTPEDLLVSADVVADAPGEVAAVTADQELDVAMAALTALLQRDARHRQDATSRGTEAAAGPQPATAPRPAPGGRWLRFPRHRRGL